MRIMTTPPLRPRAVGLIFHPQNPTQILLILRRKKGREDYATFPGGGIEQGENPAQACAREILEEVNAVVEVSEQIAELDNLQNHEHYFLTRYISGDVRLGDGPESLRHSADNWYSPQWIDIARLEEVNLVPASARALVHQHAPK